MKMSTLAVMISLLGMTGGAYADSGRQSSSKDASSADPGAVVTSPAGRKALGPQPAALRPDSAGTTEGSGAAGAGTIIAVPGHAYDAIRDSKDETPAGELIGPAPDALALGIDPHMDLSRSGAASAGR